jgi:hypothetical protein
VEISIVPRTIRRSIVSAYIDALDSVADTVSQSGAFHQSRYSDGQMRHSNGRITQRSSGTKLLGRSSFNKREENHVGPLMELFNGFALPFSEQSLIIDFRVTESRTDHRAGKQETFTIERRLMKDKDFLGKVHCEHTQSWRHYLG